MEKPLIHTEAELVGPLNLSCEAGVAVLFTARCPGEERPNEDAIAALPVPGGTLLAVCDGVGGAPAGQHAAAAVLDGLAAETAALEDPANLRAAILDGIERGNRRIRDDGVGAGCTLALAEIAGDRVRPYHVGDSGLILTGQRGRIKMQTVDHSPVGFAVESGMLDADEAMHHEDRHIVSNLIGAPDMRIEIGSPVKMASFDTLVLASDGVFDNLSREELVELIRSGPLPSVATRLASRLEQRMTAPGEGEPSKPDDASFILFRPGRG